MSLAITHFAVGASFMTLILALRFPTIRYKQSIIVLSGLWALIPDIHYVSPVFQEPLSQIKATLIGNLFWFHAAMDSFESGRGSRTAAAVAVFFLLGITLVGDYLTE